MINQIIRARVAASGIRAENVDAIAELLTGVAVNETQEAVNRIVDSTIEQSGNIGYDYREDLGRVLSMAFGRQPSYVDTVPSRGYWDRAGYLPYSSIGSIEDRYGRIEGLTTVDPDGRLAFRWVDGAPSTMPEPEEPDDEDDSEEEDANGNTYYDYGQDEELGNDTPGSCTCQNCRWDRRPTE